MLHTRDLQCISQVDNVKHSCADTIYRKKVNLNKKKKIITFVGKLNSSKGYDLFKDAVLKILNEFSDWKAYSIGDEDRRDIYINHDSHTEIGFTNHKKTYAL